MSTATYTSQWKNRTKQQRFPGAANEAVMEKAAQVHDDAARRIRAVLGGEG